MRDIRVIGHQQRQRRATTLRDYRKDAITRNIHLFLFFLFYADERERVI